MAVRGRRVGRKEVGDLAMDGTRALHISASPIPEAWRTLPVYSFGSEKRC